ncbi:MAG: nucleoside phosphorylase [Alphaproteobacteria bacterium]|nr:nucleoside phosphorylase [Alphaproteobacteria bacterium]
MLDEGAQALLSIGIAGGLSVDLGPGDVVLADAVVGHGDARRETHGLWRARVEVELRGSRVGAIYASQNAVRSPEHKSELHRTHGAVAVDMESGGVAAAANAAGVPFLALRVIADPAHRAIPRAALHGLAPDGRQRALAVLLQLVRRPGETPGLIGLARDSMTALARLRRVTSLGNALFTPPVA